METASGRHDDRLLHAAAVAVVATALVIISLNAVHALLYLSSRSWPWRSSSTCSARPSSAALEVIIYAGAIMVLFVFVVMHAQSRSGGHPTGAALADALDLDRPDRAVGSCSSSS